MVEKVAVIQHEAWMKWARALLADESVKLPTDRMERWLGYLVRYRDLSESAKKEDRYWAREAVMAVLAELGVEL
jgi:hypothetical protein